MSARLVEHLHFDIVIREPKTLFEKLTGKHHTSYITLEEIKWFSHRYQRWLTVPKGYESDGASGPAIDITSLSWWVHDWACDKKQWDDFTDITPTERSGIIFDLLMAEGRQVRAVYWAAATWVWSVTTNNRI